MLIFSPLFEAVINPQMKMEMKQAAANQAKSFENKQVSGNIQIIGPAQRVRNKMIVSGKIPISGGKKTSDIRAIYDIRSKQYQYDMNGVNPK